MDIEDQRSRLGACVDGKCSLGQKVGREATPAQVVLKAGTDRTDDRLESSKQEGDVVYRGRVPLNALTSKMDDSPGGDHA
jgi:hypothetical protein